MQKRYVFHYDRKNPSPIADYHESLDQCDGKECYADLEKTFCFEKIGEKNVMQVTAMFGAYGDLDVYTYELEEVKEDEENE